MNKNTPIVSAHYQGEAGEHYVLEKYSNPYCPQFALNAAYFKPYLKPADQILDFGCGNGGMLRCMQDGVALAEGIEVNPSAAKIARGLGLQVYASLDEIPEEPRYDAVTSNHVLEHLRDVSTTLELLRSRIKPGGFLLLKLPLEDWRGPGQRSWSKNDIDHHLQTWTPKLIANVLYEAGYEVETVRIVTSALHLKLFPLLKWGLGSLAFRALAILRKRRQLFVVGRVPG